MGYEIINYKALASAAITAGKGKLYAMTNQRAGGRAIHSNVERKAISQTNYIGSHPDEALGRNFLTDMSIGLTEKANDIVLKDVVCNISRSINVVKTPLVGLAGTIKEYISPGDYDISIMLGVECNEDGKIIDRYPAEALAQLRKLLDASQALYVSSDFLRIFDITRIVIESYTINHSEFQNYQAVEMRACSDEDYIIKCNEY